VTMQCSGCDAHENKSCGPSRDTMAAFVTKLGHTSLAGAGHHCLPWRIGEDGSASAVVKWHPQRS
jgi:hypothetical protein